MRCSLSRCFSGPAISRYPPDDQSAIADHSAQSRQNTVIAEIHVVKVEVLSVAPDLLKLDLLATSGVLIRLQEVG